MSKECSELHSLVRRGTRWSFPFDPASIPLNGICVLFEKGEECHGGTRIVRVGTHTGDGQLRSRVLQHFVMENKDRSFPQEHRQSAAEQVGGPVPGGMGT
jgi:hypothetical protein